MSYFIVNNNNNCKKFDQRVINFTFRSVIEQPLLSSANHTITEDARKKVGGVEKFPKKSACDSNKKKSASTTARRNKPPRSITRALLILAEEEKVKRAMSHRPNPASYVDNNNNNNNSNNKQNTNNSNSSNCVDEHRRWDYYNNGQ